MSRCRSDVKYAAKEICTEIGETHAVKFEKIEEEGREPLGRSVEYSMGDARLG